MSYSKQNFKSGDKLYASQLNAMDDQIIAADRAIGLDSKYIKTVSVWPDAEIIQTGGLVLAIGKFTSAGNYDSVMHMPIEPEIGTPVTVYSTINGNTALVFYDSDKNVLLGIDGNNCADYGITAELPPKEREITPPNGTRYISYTIFTSYGIITSKPVKYKAVDYSAGLIRRTADLEAVNTPVVIKTTPSVGHLRQGGMITESGSFIASANYDSVYMLPVFANAESYVSLYATIYGTTCVVFYDGGKNVLRAVSGSNCGDYGITAQLDPKVQDVPAPAGTQYISYTVFKGYGANILNHKVVSEFNANSYSHEIMDAVSLVAPKFTDVRQMKTLVIGDSISTDSNSTGINYGNYKKWVGNLIDTDFFAYGNVTNDSIHATGFVARLSDTEDDSFLARIKAVENPADFDLVIVFGGINDSIKGIPHGGDGDTDTTVYFKPAVDEFFAYLTENFINARIAVLLPLRTYSYPYSANVDHKQYEYGEYIAEVAKKYALPVLDLTNASGFRPHIASYRARWTLIPEGYESSDGVHPNAEYCKDYLAPMIRDFLSSIL